MIESAFKRVSVFGLGYIGLPTAAMFASSRIQVIGVDISQEIVDTINRGEIHIVEPDLHEIVRTVVEVTKQRPTAPVCCHIAIDFDRFQIVWRDPIQTVAG